MVLKNGKIIAQESSMDDVEGVISRDFRVKKQDEYEVKDFESDASVCLVELLDQLRADATPQKEIKFPERKRQKPIARNTPIARSPIKNKPGDFTTSARKPIKRTGITRKPIDWEKTERKAIVFPQAKPYEPPKRKAYKKPKVRRNDVVDDHYSAWLGEQPCIITGMVAERGIGPYNMHCHHVRGRIPRNDYNQVPLIGFMHTWHGDSYHVMGRHSFLEKWRDKIGDADCIIEYFESHAKAFKAEYDLIHGHDQKKCEDISDQ
ncbi:hypothetical protein D8Y20_13425 [Mariprofundus sp. EBB-1]|nr:hypothetical protein D8Y20_13425 [Mariprofundus sp. EBB-1]